MRIGRNEIIEELTEHIRQSGGEPGEWRVGTAEGQWLGEMVKFKIQNSRETPASMAGLAYREAHTTYAADDAVDYLVNAFGLQLAPQAERGSAHDGRAMAVPAMTGHGRDARATSREAERRSDLQNPAPGRIVFIYCETPLPLAASRSAQATLHKVAA